MIKAVPFFMLLFISLFSCMGEDRVTVFFSESEIELESFSLPQGFVRSDSSSAAEADLVLSVKKTVSAEEQKFSLSKEILVPLKDSGDSRLSVSLEGLFDEKLPLIPLSEWNHAGLGLMVDNLTPADTAYPLKRWRHIVLEWNTEPDTVLEMRMDNALCDYLAPGKVSSPPELVWVGAVGDMMLQRGIEDVLIDHSDGKERIFSDLLPHLSGFDLLMGNLEGAVTRAGSRIAKSFNFRFRPEALASLKQTGFDYLSITNNHCYDYGEEGFLDTLGYLKEYGIPTSGAADSLSEAREPSIFTRGDTIFRILSVGAYPQERNGFDGKTQARVTGDRAGILWYGEEALGAISAFSSEDGIDIVMVHGGHEWQRVPGAEQKRQYRAFIDAGADVVFGSHPHVLQGAEYYHGGVIYYSLGNFLFNGMEEMPFAEDSLIASLGVCEGKILYQHDIPVQINGPVVQKDQSGRILQQFRELSHSLSGR